jgi:hypothetical protein
MSYHDLPCVCGSPDGHHALSCAAQRFAAMDAERLGDAT